MSEDDIWNELGDFDLVKSVTNFKDYFHTRAFLLFNLNLSRALFQYTEAKNNIKEGFAKRSPYSNYTLEIILILLITSYEVYLEALFRDAMKHIKLSDINKEYLRKFIKNFKLSDSIFEEFKSKDDLEFPLSNLFPDTKRLNFQQNDVIKIAFKSINLDVVEFIDEIDGDLWKRIYSTEDSNPGYLIIRNKLVHRGWTYSLIYKKLIDYEKVTNCVNDITKLVYEIEKKVLEKYPKKDYSHIYLEVSTGSKKKT